MQTNTKNNPIGKNYILNPHKLEIALQESIIIMKKNMLALKAIGIIDNNNMALQYAEFLEKDIKEILNRFNEENDDEEK